ncbi:hypothetical protein GGF37_001047 [Kickxella alabastrina]|nr:hypothetical protein GGF37_001047 [Kickxella alabastrina]
MVPRQDNSGIPHNIFTHNDSDSNSNSNSNSKGMSSINSNASLRGSHLNQQQQQQHHRQYQQGVNQSLDTIISSLSPLTIGMGGLTEGMTEQQAAEVVELLTPFMSPTSTPAFGNMAAQGFLSHPTALGQQGMADGGQRRQQQQQHTVFSPLTSPALLPQHGFSWNMAGNVATGDSTQTQTQAQHQISQHISHQFQPINQNNQTYQQQQRQQQQHHQQYIHMQMYNSSLASLPPPSPSLTVEHIMRLQQQQQQQLLSQQSSPSFATFSPLALTTGRAPSTPRRTAANMSPHHHPYRNTSNGGSSASTKPGRARVGPGGGQRIENVDDFRLDALPDGSLEAAIAAAAVAKSAATVEMQPLGDLEGSSEAVNAEQALNRTLHQLNASPHFNPRSSFDHQMTLSRQQKPSPQQPLQADGSESPQSSAVSAVTATPASLMNLPLSAHHLPHSSTGEIISTTPSPHSSLISRPPPPLQPRTPTEPQQHQSPSSVLTQSAPMTKIARPPLPPPLHIGPATVAAQSGDAMLPQQQQQRARGRTISQGDCVLPLQHQQQRARRGQTAQSRRRSRASLLLSPRPTPLVPSSLKSTPLCSPAALAPRPDQQQQQQQQRQQQQRQQYHIQNQQQRLPVAATSTTNIINLEASVVTRLATKSNYQNILSGDSEALGLTYHKEFKTGLEKRRTNHKQAEQKRRDSLKSSFEDLKMRMDGMLDPKLVSKVYLLKRANGYIDRLCRVKDALERAAAEAGVDVESVVREAEMTGEEAEVGAEDTEELDGMDEDEER